MNSPIRILVADDHAIIRQGLRSLLAAEPGLEVVGEAGDGRTAVELAAELSPDVVVMDVAMPDVNGIDATRQITGGQGNGDGPKVVALSAHTDRRFVAQMLQAGAVGYVIKDVAFAELAEAVRAVAADKVYLSPSVAGAVIEDMRRGETSDSYSALSALTPREREILQLTADGKAMKEVASHLGISIKTVETHRRSLMEKLGVDSVAQLTKHAVREGLSSL